MIDHAARPRFSARVRLRFDRHEQRYMLLYPERGMLLNPSAAAVAKLCDGELSVQALIERLQAAQPDTDPGRIEREVCEFLQALSQRGLIELERDE